MWHEKNKTFMEMISSIDEMRAVIVRARDAGKRVAFVPTMGFLHNGHLSLIRKAGELCEFVVVSIFVNPIQFGVNEDLEGYPRDIERDKRLCAGEHVDVLFTPIAKLMYAGGYSTYVEEKFLSEPLCGLARTGHFKGVTTIVTKLFNIVQPDVAVFGQKDAQQARIIQRMVFDLNFPIEVVIAPIVREPDGLAMSSRNMYLGLDERKRAGCIYAALCLAEELCRQGESDPVKVKNRMSELIMREDGSNVSASIDYIEIVDHLTLRPVKNIGNAVLIAVAVRIGSTRLIDNVIVDLNVA